MRIIQSKKRPPLLIKKLLKVWESSVKATHLFLSNNEIQNIKKSVLQALKNISHLVVLENENEIPVAFMGIEKQKLEMLFVLPEEMGKGYGKKLIIYGFKSYYINNLTVNEQNPNSKGFYEHMGFYVYKRTDTDEKGNPYPLLYMRLD